LSSYLDNQLPERDRSRLETRLKSEPELRQALEDLRRTRVILRNQPRLRAPRNFTLTPATAGVRSRRLGSFAGLFASPFATLRLASALAAIFLVLLTVGDLTVRRYAPAPRAISMSEQLERPIMGMGGGGGGGGGAPMPMIAPTEEAAVEALPAAPALASEIPDQKALVVTPLGSSDAAVAGSSKEPPRVMEGQPLAGADAQLPAPQANTSAPTTPQEMPPSSTLIQALQALLLLLAVGAGAAAVLMRRNTG
jgi:hypothetical protein